MKVSNDSKASYQYKFCNFFIDYEILEDDFLELFQMYKTRKTNHQGCKV